MWLLKFLSVTCHAWPPCADLSPCFSAILTPADPTKHVLYVVSIAHRPVATVNRHTTH
jgi:hypothetical protein